MKARLFTVFDENPVVEAVEALVVVLGVVVSVGRESRMLSTWNIAVGHIVGPQSCLPDVGESDEDGSDSGSSSNMTVVGRIVDWVWGGIVHSLSVRRHY